MATQQTSSFARTTASTKLHAAEQDALRLTPEFAADEASYALTDSQKEILAMLEDRPPLATDAALQAAPGGVGLDVAFAAVGASAMVAGATMVFFFAALGAVLLVAGAILCAVAFEHVALRDLRAEEAALEAAGVAALNEEA